MIFTSSLLQWGGIFPFCIFSSFKMTSISVSSRRFFFAIGLTFLLVATGGCTLFAPKLPKSSEEIIRSGVDNLYAQTSSAFELKGNATLLGKDGEGKPQNSTVHLNITGDSARKAGASGLNLHTQADLSINQEKYNAQAELRMNEKNLFAILQSFNGSGADSIANIVRVYQGQWWKFPLSNDIKALEEGQKPQDVKTQKGVKDIAKKDKVKPQEDSNKAQDMLTAQMAQVKELASGLIPYLQNISYEGVDAIHGLSSYHFSAQLDMTKVRQFLLNLRKERNGEVTPQDEKSLDELLASTRTDVDLWVSEQGEILDQIQLRLKVDKIIGSDGTSGGKGDALITITEFDFGKDVAVQEPADAKDFALFGE